jgi:hypothetical protein
MERLGGDRLLGMPAALGLRPRPISRCEVNRAPHPLA